MPGRRILYLSRWYPFPPDNGSRLRVWHHLRALSRSYDVTLISFAAAAQQPAEVEPFCERVVTVPYIPFVPTRGRARLGFLSRRPRSLVDTESAAMRAAVESEVRAGGIAAVVLSTLELMPYRDALGDLPAILDDAEFGSLAEAMRTSSLWRRARARASWLKQRGYLRRELARYAACSVTSEAELALFREAVPGAPFLVIENAVDVGDPPCAARQPHRLVFNGSLSYSPNRTAMEWFCRRVLPRIRAEVPDVELMISGQLPAEGFAAGDGVHLAGRVDDIRALVASASICVAPIRSGGGTRLKILEAMALGTAVVATSKCVEGLAVVHDRHLLLAEEEETFAAQVLRLLRDAGLAERLTRAARALVAERYDAARVGEKFRLLVESAAAARSA